MPKGGHARSGPAPDPNSLRQDKNRSSWITLPAEGRQGDPPPWPLTRPKARELHYWARLWAKPQAVMWEELDLVEDVALYVRYLLTAEKPNATAASFTPVRQLSESLGISVPGMHKNLWKLGKPAAPPEQSAGDAGTIVPMRPRVVADLNES